MSGTRCFSTSSVLVLLAALMMATFWDTSGASAQRGTQVFCLSAGLLCVNTTQQQYNRCYSLALRRGFSSRRDDDYGRNNFIYQCLGGRGGR
jgi:hypothetical protein